MNILIVRLDRNTALEQGSRYFVKDAREAALVVAGVKNSTPDPAGVIVNFFEVSLTNKNVTELPIPKVVFAID